jgi:hypothetical protein
VSFSKLTAVTISGPPARSCSAECVLVPNPRSDSMPGTPGQPRCGGGDSTTNEAGRATSSPAALLHRFASRSYVRLFSNDQPHYSANHATDDQPPRDARGTKSLRAFRCI